MKRVLVLAGASLAAWGFAYLISHATPAAWFPIILAAWVVVVGATIDLLWHREWHSFEARTFLTLYGCLALFVSHSLLSRVFGLTLPLWVPMGLTAWITVALAANWRSLRKARREFRHRRHDDPVPDTKDSL